MTRESRMAGDAPDALRLGKRLEEVAWALFLIMTGALWLVPQGLAPDGTWLAGLGLILLGLNAARHRYQLRVNGLVIVVGAAALVAGIGRILGRELPLVPILIVALGAAVALRTIARARKHDDAASASLGG
jgi:hypothetical protein